MIQLILEAVIKQSKFKAQTMENNNQGCKSPAEYLASKYVFSGQENKFIDRNTKCRFSSSAFNILEKHNMPFNPKTEDKLKPVTVFENSNFSVKVSDIEYDPSKDEFYQNDYGIDVYNIFKNDRPQPLDGDASPILNHIMYLYDENEDWANALLDRLAYMLQKPGKITSYMDVIVSEQGKGKDAIGDLLEKVFGPSNFIKITNKELNSSFNSFIAGRMIGIVPEFSTSNSEVYRGLKETIANRHVRIVKKGKDGVSHRNFIGMIGFANPGSPIFLEEGDRRFQIYRSKSKPKNRQYYDELYDFIDSKDGPGIFLKHLLKRDISNFNPHAHAMESEYKRMLYDANKDETIAYLDDAWDAQDDWTTADLIEVKTIEKVLTENNVNFNSQKIRYWLTEKGACKLGAKRVTGLKTKPSLYALRNYEQYKNAKAHILAIGMKTRDQVKTEEFHCEKTKQHLIEIAKQNVPQLAEYYANILEKHLYDPKNKNSVDKMIFYHHIKSWDTARSLEKIK